ncbi:ParA family protein [Shimia thalassica]|uniref:ParA family protein n=1 Tax=Shimia thalassica TaxID=1715693 RepID=UPI0026E1E2AE|nr:ParA family protein [Shimia thalassica]MDO6481871.1 ParA family protein [Shimia thalassica]
MPTISFCSPKGGCGKSTSCILLALEIARRGLSVTVIDSDPKGWLSSWASLKPLPEGLSVKKAAQDELTEVAMDAADDVDYVLVDVEGSDDASIIDAIMVSDLVIVPSQASRLDALGAVQTLKQVRRRSKLLNREIPARVLMTLTEAGAVQYRITGEVKDILKEAGAPLMSVQLGYRPIFKCMVTFGGDYLDLPAHLQGSSPDSAKENVAALAHEIADILTSEIALAAE